MLRALYDYGIRNHLAIPPGFSEKVIYAYICLSASGKYLGIEQCREEKQICPDIGSLANGTDKCNPLAEKAGVVLGQSGKKTECFREFLKEGGACAACLQLCLNALEDETVFAEIRQDANLRKVKDSDRISFRVGDLPVTADPQMQQWWTEYRKKFVGGAGAPDARCLITGEPTVPLATLTTVNGLQVVGGHSRGEALFCFDKDAFQSYGFKKSANAPVSEEAFSVVREAMNDLLKGAPAMYERDVRQNFQPIAPIYAGIKFLHWYDFSLNPQDDMLYQSFQGGAGGEAEDGSEELPEDAEEAEEERREYLLMQQSRADEVVRAITSGAPPKKLHGEYHILLISGNNGRAMVRRYEHGNYEMLRENLRKWADDLKLQDRLGTGLVREKKLSYRLTRLIKLQKGVGQKLPDRMKKELAGVTPTIVMAIVNGTPLPDTVAVRALAYIRSRLLSSDDEKRKQLLPDDIACQWLKVWLIRKRRMRNEEENLMEYYDPGFPSAAYHSGAWLAVYANLQRAAMGDVNATLVQRFYASASRTPALVFGTLERMGEVYLDVLRKDKPGLDRIYEEKLNSVCTFFGSGEGHQLPATLNLEGQSYFALGYRHMCTQIIAEMKARAAEKQAEKQEEE